MAQDFWAASGFRHLERHADGGLVPTDAWIAGFLSREELKPPLEAGAAERALHERLVAEPRAGVQPAELGAVEDEDARGNWTAFLHFRDRLLAHPTLESFYADLFRRPAVDVAPPFIDAVAQAITRGILDGTEDAWLCRAGELFFRRQRIAVEGGRVLAADASTIEAFAETGGFGNVGRLLQQQGTELPTPKLDVLTHENAALYFLRDELHGFLLDIAPGGEGAKALARLLERWIGHFHGVAVDVEPVERVEDTRWRWHVGLDVDATAILNGLYEGRAVPEEDQLRLATLFAMRFRDPADAVADLGDRPVYLGLAFRPDHSLKVKPQNLITNLPIARAG